MPDRSRWDLDERGIPTFVAAQAFSIATVPGADGGFLLIEYATSYENALANVLEKTQVYLLKEQAEALAADLLKLASLPGKAQIQ